MGRVEKIAISILSYRERRLKIARFPEFEVNMARKKAYSQEDLWSVRE